MIVNELRFDLEFLNTGGVCPITSDGVRFLDEMVSPDDSLRQIYVQAADKGLHVRFANVDLRDCVAEVRS